MMYIYYIIENKIENTVRMYPDQILLTIQLKSVSKNLSCSIDSSGIVIAMSLNTYIRLHVSHKIKINIRIIT